MEIDMIAAWIIPCQNILMGWSYPCLLEKINITHPFACFNEDSDEEVFDCHY